MLWGHGVVIVSIGHIVPLTSVIRYQIVYEFKESFHIVVVAWFVITIAGVHR